MKKIVVVCGAGFATSSLIADNILELLEKKGFSTSDIKIIKARIDNLQDYVEGADLIVSANPIPESLSKGVPVIRSLAFMTGVGLDEAVEEIIKKLNLKP